MQVTGRVTIKLDSDSLRTKPGATLQIGGIERQFDVTDQDQAYFRERSTPAAIKGTIVHASDTDLIALRKWKNGTAVFQTDSDHVYTIANAAVATIGELNGGEVEVTIMGDPASE